MLFSNQNKLLNSITCQPRVFSLVFETVREIVGPRRVIH